MFDNVVQGSSTISHGQYQEHLEDWVLNGIRNHVLGSRLLSLSRNEELLQKWYSRYVWNVHMLVSVMVAHKQMQMLSDFLIASLIYWYLSLLIGGRCSGKLYFAKTVKWVLS